MNVSLIIPVLNNEKTLAKCMSSLSKQLAEGDEFIVVDSKSSDSSAEVAKSFNARVISRLCNRSKARNIGWKAAKNNIILFIESDSVYDKNYIKEMKKAFSDENIMCAIDRRAHYKPSTWVSRTLQKEFELRQNNNYKPPNPWILRKSVLVQVRGFDESLEYGEDADLGIRVRKAGHNIHYLPKAVQYHLGEPKTLEDVIKRAWKFGKNMKKFYAKHHNMPAAKTLLFTASIIFPPLIIIIFIINILRYKKIGLFSASKLSIINIARNLFFSISYITSIFFSGKDI